MHENKLLTDEMCSDAIQSIAILATKYLIVRQVPLRDSQQTPDARQDDDELLASRAITIWGTVGSGDSGLSGERKEYRTIWEGSKVPRSKLTAAGIVRAKGNCRLSKYNPQRQDN